jgi:hypothetical protein
MNENALVSTAITLLDAALRAAIARGPSGRRRPIFRHLARTPSWEIERHFLCRPDDVPRLLDPISAVLPQTTVCWVRTTYFDSANLDLWRTLGGPCPTRLRLREYALADKSEWTGSCSLELKESTGNVRRKRRLSLRPDEARLLLETCASEGLVAMIGTFYKRWTLTSPSLHERVTVDEEIQVIEPTPPRSPTPPSLAHLRDCVVELKTDGSVPCQVPILPALRESPGFSKYREAMALVPGVSRALRLGEVRSRVSGARRP